MFPTEQSAQLQGEPLAKHSLLCAVYSELGCEVRLGATSSEEHTATSGLPLYPGLIVMPATAPRVVGCLNSYLIKGRKEWCF